MMRRAMVPFDCVESLTRRPGLMQRQPLMSLKYKKGEKLKFLTFKEILDSVLELELEKFLKN